VQQTFSHYIHFMYFTIIFRSTHVSQNHPIPFTFSGKHFLSFHIFRVHAPPTSLSLNFYCHNIGRRVQIARVLFKTFCTEFFSFLYVNLEYSRQQFSDSVAMQCSQYSNDTYSIVLPPTDISLVSFDSVITITF
jgi:hypothetical protein